MATDLPPGALSAKLRDAKQKARLETLRELGIEDPEKWRAEQKSIRDQLAAHEQSKQEAERAQMSEVERLKADLAARDERIRQLEAEAMNAKREAQASKASTIIQRTIGEHIDPSMYDAAEDALHRYFKSLPKEQQRKFGEAEAKAFFAKLAKEKPRFAKESPSAAPKALPRRPLTNGVSPKKLAPPAKPPTSNGSKPASQLTKDELRAKWGKFNARPPG